MKFELYFLRAFWDARLLFVSLYVGNFLKDLEFESWIPP